MQNLVLVLLGMSLDAAVVICAVCLLRFGFRRLPKSYSCVLWLLVLFRLLCPVTISSSFSLMPDIRSLVQEEIDSQEGKQDSKDRPVPNVMQTGEKAVPATGTGAGWQQGDSGEMSGDGERQDGTNGNALNAARNGAAASLPMRVSLWERQAAGKLGAFWKSRNGIICLVWALGAVVFAAAYLIQYGRLSRQVKSWKRINADEAGRIGDNVRILENAEVPEPFVYGVLHPVICIPADMEEKERAYILHHERMHIRHLDPAFRFLWQVALILHWFNPLVWMAIALMQKDMEMFCDESVMRECGGSARKEYAMTLLRFSAQKSGLPFPIAFGESNTESRIYHILKVKRPALVASAIAVLAIAAAAAILLTNPGQEQNPAEVPETQEQTNTPEAREDIPETQESAAISETEEPGSDIGDDEAADRADQMLDLAHRFADAFVERNGNEMVKLLADPSQMDAYKLEDGGYAIGWSSPWPWGGYECRFNYAYDRDEVVIYYYAVTSDVRIWPWRQVLWLTQKDGKYLVEGGELDMEAVTSVAAFQKRFRYEPSEEYGLSYGTGYRFRDTPLDFLGQAQEENDYIWVQALWNQEDQDSIKGMYGTPEAAAATQLYLEDGQAIEVECPWENEVCLRWKFDDGETDVIRLSRLYTYEEDHSKKESGLWVVRDILEEQDYQEEITRRHQINYYLENPEKLAESDLEGVDGLMNAAALSSNSVTVQLAETDDKTAVLYGLMVRGDMQGVFLKESGKLTFFDWYYTSPHLVLPVLAKADYDGDGQEELAVILNAYTGTGVDVEQLKMLERTSDGRWTEKEFPDSAYGEELEAEIEITFDQEQNKISYRETGTDEVLGEEELSEFLGGESEYEYEGVRFGDIVYFIPEGNDIYMEIGPGLELKGMPMLGYTGSVLRAKVSYDGTGFSLGGYQLIVPEEE